MPNPDGENAIPAIPDRADAFVRLFTRHESRLHGYILTMVPNWADAADILQETSSILWKKFPEFEPNSNFFAWACSIARLEVATFRRRNRHALFPISDEFVEIVAAKTGQLGDQLESRMALLAGCLEKLRPQERELLSSRYLEGGNVEATAARSGRTIEAVYKALQRIRRQLFDCVERATLAGERP